MWRPADRLPLVLAALLTPACFSDDPPTFTNSSASAASTGPVTTSTSTTGDATDPHTVAAASSEPPSTTGDPTTSDPTTGDPTTADPTTAVTTTADATTGAPACGDALYASDFEANPMLEALGGDWIHEAGVLRIDLAENEPPAVVWPGIQAWSDFRATTHLRFALESGRAGLVVRAGYTPNFEAWQGYVVIIDAAAATAVLGPTDGVMLTEMAAVGLGAVNLTQWHELAVSVVGSNLSVALDGESILDDLQIDFTNGSVALFAHTAAVAFDDLVVCAL